MTTRLHILTFTTLYPSAEMPSHGIFVENRLREVAKNTDITFTVVAPVPFFPFGHQIFGKYACFARTPYLEKRFGIEVRHPRYLLPPKVGMNIAPGSLTNCLRREVRRLFEEGHQFDLLDAHYFYPDGVAAAKISKELGLPLTITARGTDINLLPKFPKQREMILNAARIADHSITVCNALKDEMVDLGCSSEKISVFRNGVDLQKFAPIEHIDAVPLEVGRKVVLLSVGHLIDRKGHDRVIRSLEFLPNAKLLIAGEGEQESNLKSIVAEQGYSDRVSFLGHIAHERLREVYNAADILVLASDREGWPNVLLEAMACGTPCVANNIWGSGEVIQSEDAGVLIPDRSAETIATGVKQLLARGINRAKTRAYAERFSWTETTDNIVNLFNTILRSRDTSSDPFSNSKSWHAVAGIKRTASDPKLLITVDTEEIFDWNDGQYNKHSIADPADIARFQDMCESHNARPLYFISWPLLNDPQTVRYFSELHASNKADLGLHLHGWVTPPLAEKYDDYTSYQNNLDPDVHRAKLSELLQKFKDAFGFVPNAHRAGRYGVSPSVHNDLLDAGIRFDFSPSAGYDYSSAGGPDFSGMTSHAWHRCDKDVSKHLICVPVSGGLKIARSSKYVRQLAQNFGSHRSVPNALRSKTAPVRVSPEGVPLGELKLLTRSLIQDEVPVITFTLHSTSLTPGATPYSATKQNVKATLSKSNSYLEWFQTECGGEFTSLAEIKDVL